MGEFKKGAKKFTEDTVTRWIQKNIGDGLTWLCVTFGGGYVLGAIRSFSFRPAEIFAWFLANPGTAYSVALGTTGLVYLFRLALLRRENRIKEHRARVAIGLFTYFDPETDGKDAPWDFCVDKLGDLNPTELDILGVTGWNTFASDNAPLRKLVDSFTGNLRILLLSPDSDGFKRRVEDLALMQDNTVSEDQHKTLTEVLKKEFDDTIKYCERLAKKPVSRLRSIEVKSYEDKPIWKLLFANDHVWVQQYDVHHHVADTPSFVFRHNPSLRTSFWRSFWGVWCRRWEHDKSKTLVSRH